MGVAVDLIVLTKRWLLELFDCLNKLLLGKMRAIQNSILLCFKVFRIGLRHRLISIHKITDRVDDVVLDVLNKCIDKWTSNISNSAFNPTIIMQEVPFTSQNAKIQCKVVVFAVNNLNQTISDFLGNIENSGQVHHPLIMLAELADASNEQALVALEQLLKHNG